MSGGVDSRLTLACIIGAGVKESFKFFNINNSLNKKSADQIVAESLAEKFDLQGGQGITEAITGTATKNSFYRINGGNKVLFGTYAYFGLLPAAFEDYGEVKLNDYGRVTGYCGEHTRAPGPNLGNIVRAESNEFVHLATKAYLQNWFDTSKNNASKFLEPDSKLSMEAPLFEYITEIVNEVGDNKLLNTLFYLENRSRFHFGVRRQVGNKARIVLSPLGSPLLLKLHKSLTYGQIFSNKIALDLMISLVGKSLALMPYAEFRWARNVIDDIAPDYIDKCVIIHDREKEMGDKSHVFPPPVILTKISDHGPIASGYSEYLGSNSDSLASFIYYILNCIEHSTGNHFAIERLKSFDESKASPQEKMNIRRLLSAIVFYYGIGQVPKISKELDVSNLTHTNAMSNA